MWPILKFLVSAVRILATQPLAIRQAAQPHPRERTHIGADPYKIEQNSLRLASHCSLFAAPTWIKACASLSPV